MTKFSIYQVLTRSFGIRNNNPKTNGDIDENGCGKLNNFTTEALNAIKDLGITHIWYTGIIRHATTTKYKHIPENTAEIVKGKAGSPYAITDYYDVHPDLAENIETRIVEFEALIKRTHNSDLKAIIDFIPNHVSREYKSIMKPEGVDDFGETDQSNYAFYAQNNFYYLPNEKLKLPFDSDFSENPAKASGNDVFNAFPQKHDWYETIKLNYGIDYQDGNSKHFYPTPKTWIQMRDILLYWTSKGIDGFRCDMVEMVPVEFWEWAIPQIKKANNNILFIAEIYNPRLYRSYIEQGKFDYLYDKVGLYDTLRSIIEGRQSAEAISSVWQNLDGLDKKMLRFLENHDEQRIASRFFAENPIKAIPAFFLTATMHQNPFLIYSGQEFGEKASGESGFSGDDGRSSIFDYGYLPSIYNWQVEHKYKVAQLNTEKQILYSHYQNITKFALNEKAIIDGNFYDLMWANKGNGFFKSDSVYAFLRSSKNRHLLCLTNFSNQELNVLVKLPFDALNYCGIEKPNLLNFKFMDQFSSDAIAITGLELIETGISIKLDAFSYCAYLF